MCQEGMTGGKGAQARATLRSVDVGRKGRRSGRSCEGRSAARPVCPLLFRLPGVSLRQERRRGEAPQRPGPPCRGPRRARELPLAARAAWTDATASLCRSRGVGGCEVFPCRPHGGVGREGFPLPFARGRRTRGLHLAARVTSADARASPAVRAAQGSARASAWRRRLRGIPCPGATSPAKAGRSDASGRGSAGRTGGAAAPERLETRPGRV